MKIFVGNLSTSAGENELKKLFVPYGEVITSTIVYDLFSRRSRGFGFVEMNSRSDGEVAVTKLNNKLYMQQSLVVHEAKG